MIYLPIHQLRLAPVRSSDSNPFIAKKSCSSWEKISTKWELTDQQNSWALLQVIEVVALNKVQPILTWVASVQYFGQSDFEFSSFNSVEPLAKAMQKRKVEMAFFSDMSTRVPPSQFSRTTNIGLDFSPQDYCWFWSLCVRRSSYLGFTIHILCLRPLCNQKGIIDAYKVPFSACTKKWIVSWRKKSCARWCYQYFICDSKLGYPHRIYGISAT